jgi:hypothetical protein
VRSIENLRPAKVTVKVVLSIVVATTVRDPSKRFVAGTHKKKDFCCGSLG